VMLGAFCAVMEHGPRHEGIELDIKAFKDLYQREEMRDPQDEHFF
jgi:hypothetical protein